MMEHLKVILREDDIDTIYNLIEQFKTNFSYHELFLRYVEETWIAAKYLFGPGWDMGSTCLSPQLSILL